jgi:hypothetical protein
MAVNSVGQTGGITAETVIINNARSPWPPSDPPKPKRKGRVRRAIEELSWIAGIVVAAFAVGDVASAHWSWIESLFVGKDDGASGQHSAPPDRPIGPPPVTTSKPSETAVDRSNPAPPATGAVPVAKSGPTSPAPGDGLSRASTTAPVRVRPRKLRKIPADQGEEEDAAEGQVSSESTEEGESDEAEEQRAEKHPDNPGCRAEETTAKVPEQYAAASSPPAVGKANQAIVQETAAPSPDGAVIANNVMPAAKKSLQRLPPEDRATAEALMDEAAKDLASSSTSKDPNLDVFVTVTRLPNGTFVRNIRVGQ